LWSNFYIPEFNVEPDHIQKLAGGSPGRQKVNSIIGEVVYEQARKVIADGVDTKLFQFDWLYKCHHPALRY
jgi:REP element-mobilizing transposase RayT